MAAAGTATNMADSDVIDWEGKDDPRNPMNWTSRRKWNNLAVICALTFLTPMASSMIAPAIPLIMKDFNFNNETVASFVVSIYVLGYAVGPLIWAPLSELYGRVPIYHICSIMFVIWTAACALAPNIGALLAFRLFAGLVGSCPITIGGASVADVYPPPKRGGAMAVVALGPLIGPCVGPVTGGFLSDAAGWRWVFWVITIAAALVAMWSTICQRETYESVLLQRLTQKRITDTGNRALRSRLASDSSKQRYMIQALIRPTKMLVCSPIVLCFSIYTAVVYGYIYLVFTTLTPIYETVYHFTAGLAGLTYLGIGLGSLLGLVVFGVISDRLYKHLTTKHGGEVKPEYRLPPLIFGSVFIPIGLFWYGWSVEAHAHWIMGIVGTLWIGVGLMAIFIPIQLYLVDAYTLHSASAVAANTFLRSLVGAFLPFAGPKLYASLGLGWGNSLLAFIALALSPTGWVFWKYGEKIRKSTKITF